MNQAIEKFEGLNGCQLYYKAWIPDVGPKAVLAIVHGAGEHIDRYQTLATSLLPSGYAIIGYEQRGHGRSDGRRGHIYSWDEYRSDLAIFLYRVAEMVPDIPVFLLGHSLGSLVVLDYIIQEPLGLTGAIVSGTSLDPTKAAPPLQVFLAKILSGIWPTFSMKVPLPGSSLSRNPQVAKAYDSDPMVHRTRSARWGTECLKVIDWIKENPGRVKIPMLFIHGERDPLVTAEGARQFFDQIQSPDKTIHIYPQNLHEPLSDLDYQQVISDIETWMAQHL